MAGDASSREQLEVKGFKGREDLTTTKTLVIRSVTYLEPPQVQGRVNLINSAASLTNPTRNAGSKVRASEANVRPKGTVKAGDDVAAESSGALKIPSKTPKSEKPPQAETAHNPPMNDVTRAELDAKFELLDTKLGARIQQAVDAMQARDEVHKHALEKMQAEFTSRDALYAEIAKRQDLSTEKLKSEMAGRDAVYAEIAKRQELAAEKFREEMAGRDAVAAERARAHELTVQKALAEAAGREAVMDQRLKSMDGEIAKMGDGFRSVKANIWFGVATIVAAVGATVAIAIGSFDSGRETSKAIAESTVKLEQLIKAQEAKAAAPAAPAAPSAATPAPAATPKSPSAK